MAMLLSFAVFVAFLLTVFLTRRFCDPVSWLHVLDHPNERSLHTRPTPRTGGVAVLAGILAATLFWVPAVGAPASLTWLGSGAAIVAVLSFMDDRRGLPVAGRFAGHLFAAGLVIAGGGYLPLLSLPGLAWAWPPWAGIGFSLLFLVWMLNLYNFMDGMDGFAGGMAVIGFGAFAALGALAGHLPFAILSLVIAAACGGFLLFNFPPARIFMGDAGSSTLGFLAGGLCLWAARDGLFPLWIGLLVFSPFIVDASVTLTRRALRGERVWQAHKTHYYQRLVQLGWGHRRTVLWEYVLMLACAASAIGAAGMTVGWQAVVLGVWCTIYIMLMASVRSLELRSKLP